jgi:hypothetical protein
MNLMPLATRLQTLAVGTLASTIFINMMPMEQPDAVLLRNKLQGTEIDYELPGFFRTKFQLVARGKTYQLADALIAKAITALTFAETQMTGSYFVRYSRPLTMPVSFPLSNGNLIEFACDMEICFIA